MSTRSHIIVTDGQNTHYVYHHCNGHLDGVGAELKYFIISMVGSYLTHRYLNMYCCFIFKYLAYCSNFLLIFLILLMILMAGISALFNGFAGLVTAYVYELITGIQKGRNEKNSIDFEIK